MIETTRLLIKPLTYSQVQKYIENDGSLENELKIKASAIIISEELKEAFEQVILPQLADETSNYLYSTLWTIILKSENCMIGDICFQGEPNGYGEVEIGYGTYKQFQNKGLMTEAVDGLLQWAKKQSEIKSVIATTEKENVASHKVLLKNNFIKCAEENNQLKWRIYF